MSEEMREIEIIAKSTLHNDKCKTVLIIDQLIKSQGGLVSDLLVIAIAKNEENAKIEIDEYRKAVEQSVNIISHLSMGLMENKTSRKAKDFIRYMFSGDGVHYLTPIFMKRNKDGTQHKGDSPNGRWLFGKFKNSVDMKSLDDNNWAKTFGYDKYLKIVKGSKSE